MTNCRVGPGTADPLLCFPSIPPPHPSGRTPQSFLTLHATTKRQQFSQPSLSADAVVMAAWRLFLLATCSCWAAGAGDSDGRGPDASFIFWWRIPDTDCPYTDVHLNGSSKASLCSHPSDSGTCTVQSCETECLRIPGCAGFNYPHGVLTTANCTRAAISNNEVDLYLARTSPQPPPPSNFPPVWPHPKQFTNGTRTLVLAGGQQFSGGTTQKFACPFPFPN